MHFLVQARFTCPLNALPTLLIQLHPSADLGHLEQYKIGMLQHDPHGSSLTICIVRQIQELIFFSFLL